MVITLLNTITGITTKTNFLFKHQPLKPSTKFKSKTKYINWNNSKSIKKRNFSNCECGISQ
jgi:hypothetical protein